MRVCTHACVQTVGAPSDAGTGSGCVTYVYDDVTYVCRMLGLPAMLALAVVVLTHCNNYVTTRYFHSTEVFLSLVVEVFFFS